MKERIFENWKTSLITLVIMGASFAAVFTGHATLIEASTASIASLTFLFLKDPKKKCEG